MRLSLLLQPHHRRSQYLLIILNLLPLLLPILLIYFVPLQRVLGRVVLLVPVGDVAGNEGLPELCILAADLWGVDLDSVKLFWGFDSLEDGSDLPVLKGSDICKAWMC